MHMIGKSDKIAVMLTESNSILLMDTTTQQRLVVTKSTELRKLLLAAAKEQKKSKALRKIQSKDHVNFDTAYEYFVFEGTIHRALITSPMDGDFRAPHHLFEAAK